MEDYNWKNHYAVELTELDNTGVFSHFKIDDGTGQGRVISCTVFPGIQAVYNDLYLLHCGKTVPKTEEIVEINYCAEGRYECDVNSRYCFYTSPGDLSVGSAGRREAAGSFLTGRFEGLTLFVDLAAAKEHNAVTLRDMKIDLDVISRMAVLEPRRFYIRGKKEIAIVCRQMISAVEDCCLPLLKLRTMELLMFISDKELLCGNDIPVYLSQKNAQLAKAVRQKITSDLSRHVTLKQLSEGLHTSPTAIKTSFKNVYGEPIRDHMRTVRLQEAQRLLRETDLPIAEIAERVGYANPGHFSVAFHERFSMTPSEYKKIVRTGR